MADQSKSVLTWICVSVFVLVNLCGLALTHHRRQMEASVNRYLQQVRGRQGRVLAEWHSDVHLPLQSAPCGQRLNTLSASEALTVPHDATELSPAELPPNAARDLRRSVVGLVRAYQKGTANALLEYMQGRGERISTTSIDRMQSYLVQQYGMKESELESLSPPVLLKTFWHTVGIAPAWEALVPGDSGLHIWQSSGTSVEALSDPKRLARFDEKLWMRKAHIHHNFTNASGMELADELADGSKVTVADLRLVIKHKASGVHSICPYVVRFWYNTAQQKWAPHLMLQFRTSRDIPVRLLF